jgi:hypothetical protein
VPHPMVVMGESRRGSSVLVEGLISKNCQRNIHLVRNFYMRCSLTTTLFLTSLRAITHPEARRLHSLPLHQQVLPLGSPAAFAPDQGARACSFVPYQMAE